MDECRNICINALIECNAYSKKDDVSNVSSSDDNVENCARDCMVNDSADNSYLCDDNYMY